MFHISGFLEIVCVPLKPKRGDLVALERCPFPQVIFNSDPAENAIRRENRQPETKLVSMREINAHALG
jgi:hypothetical protein